MSRRYIKTHSFIDFGASWAEMPASTWALLGEAVSKVEHLANTPMAPALALELHQVYLAKGVAATTAIEGNTLSEEQVRQEMAGALRVPKSSAYQQQEVRNALQAFGLVSTQVLALEPMPLSLDHLTQCNAVLLSGPLPLGPEVVPGALRAHLVKVGPYTAPPAEDCAFLLSRMCAWLTAEWTDEPAMWMHHGILKAVMAHLYVAWIHPFGDGNGRTARLVEQRLLMEHGVPTVASHLLSNHYNRNRDAYYMALQRASQVGGGHIQFVTFAVQGFVDELRHQIGVIQKTRRLELWAELVTQNVPAHGTTSDRRRAVAIAYAKFSPDVREAALSGYYSGVSASTRARDIAALLRANLLVKVGSEELVANLDLLYRLLPARRTLA